MHQRPKLRMRLRLKPLLLAAAIAQLSACAVGPDYQKPDVKMPVQYKETVARNDAWKIAAPQDNAERGAWWQVYGDAQLDQLQRQLNIDNQNIAAAEARYR